MKKTQAHAPHPKPTKGAALKINRLLNTISKFILLFVTVFTVREVAATATVDSHRKSRSGMTCASLPSHYSIHNKENKS